MPRAGPEPVPAIVPQRLANRKAEEASLAKDEFLATASHELRTPLNAILGWAHLLRSGKLDSSAYLRGVETIERNARAQVQLIEDILDGSRIITGKLQLEIRPLDLTGLAQAALDAIRPAADASRSSSQFRWIPRPRASWATRSEPAAFHPPRIDPTRARSGARAC